MNTIYDGSFVLGQTSATNFVAGPGIKIDEPSAGTVRIGNDETVLFEDTNGHSMDTSIELSENVDNFDSIKLYYTCWGGASPRVLEFFYDKGNSNYDTLISNLEQFSTNGLKVINWKFSPLNSTNKKTLTLIYFAYFDGSFKETNLTKSNFKVYKVIGINRISGSNA